MHVHGHTAMRTQAHTLTSVFTDIHMREDNTHQPHYITESHTLRASAGHPGDDHCGLRVWNKVGSHSSLAEGWGPILQAMKVVTASPCKVTYKFPLCSVVGSGTLGAEERMPNLRGTSLTEVKLPAALGHR